MHEDEQRHVSGSDTRRSLDARHRVRGRFVFPGVEHISQWRAIMEG